MGLVVATITMVDIYAEAVLIQMAYPAVESEAQSYHLKKHHPTHENRVE